jgi:hypothetical protein
LNLFLLGPRDSLVMSPVDVLVLNLHHLAPPAAGFQGADKPVAYLSANREFRIRIPEFASENFGCRAVARC